MQYLIEAEKYYDTMCNFGCDWGGGCTCFAGTTYDSCTTYTPCPSLCFVQVCTPVQIVPSGGKV